MSAEFIVIKYYPNRDIEEMHEFVTMCDTGSELDKVVLELEDEQETYNSDDWEYFDIITLPINYGKVL
jgi:hypothetical protein